MANMYEIVIHGVAKNDANLEGPEIIANIVKELSIVNSINIMWVTPLLRKPQNPKALIHSIIIYTDNINHIDKLKLCKIHIGN
jgi:hypothetical protein